VADLIDLLSFCRVREVTWSFIAREAQRPGGVERLLAGDASERSLEAETTLRALAAAASSADERRSWVVEVVERARADGYRLTTVLDDDYPVNLRLVQNLPPFLFYMGELRPDDAYSVAVVGTRQPSAEGVIRARKALRLKARALSAEAKVSAGVLAALPFLVGGAMYVINRDLMVSLYADPRGRFMVGVAFLSLLTGLTIMYVMVKRAMR